MTIRIAALASGRGSNLQAVLDAIAVGSLDARIVGVFSDKPAAPALQRVPEALRWSRSPKSCTDRAAFDDALAEAVAASNPDWILCVGYMRILGAAFVAHYAGRLLNIHPSLLPRHKGRATHQKVLAAGEHEHGASVHFVTAELDGGPVVLQGRVPVHPYDDVAALSARVQRCEHRIYPKVVQWFASGRLRCGAAGVEFEGRPLPLPPVEDCNVTEQ